MTVAVLLLALAAFAALVAAIVTGNVWWAIACIVLAIIGAVILAIDVVKKRGKSSKRPKSPKGQKSAGRTKSEQTPPSSNTDKS